MSGEIIDFGEERFRHGQLFGREDVLEKLCSHLLGERALGQGWMLLLGSPGIGKSAIVNRLLDRLPPETPRHFLRRGTKGWDRPAVVVQNLCAQIERLYPSEQINVEMQFEARLDHLLQRVSKNHLVPNNQRLILVLDGLDEAASDDAGQNPLPRLLPSVLPRGVVIVCASRPMYPHLDWLTGRGTMHQVNLDGAEWQRSNEAAVRGFWVYQAATFSPPLDRAFVERAVRCAGGNLLHSILLRDWIEGQPAERRVATNLPRGLAGFLTQSWSAFLQLDREQRERVLLALGLACAAREALPGYLFGELIGASTSDGEDLLQVIRPFLLEEPAHWHDEKQAYRLYHESFREFILEKIGQQKIRKHHLRLAETIAAWPPEGPDSVWRVYALRHAVAHRIEASDLNDALRVCTDIDYLEAKCRALGVEAVERDLEALIRALGRDDSLDLSALLAALRAETQRICAEPASLPSRLHSRLCCVGWAPWRIERALGFHDGPPPLRLLHSVRLAPTLLRAFLDHERPVVCAVTPDGSHLLSASGDRTLRLWALASGDCLAVLKGHDDELTGLSITPDGTTAVSTSTDATVRLWDLATRTCTATLDNEGRWATACALTPDGLLLVIGSDNGTITLWDRATRRRMKTLAGHTSYVTSCLVTPTGKLISASRDSSVRVWNLGSGKCLHTFQPAEGLTSVVSGANGEQGWITALALLPGDLQVLAAAGDGSLSRWELASGRCVQRFGEGQGRMDACLMLPGGHHVLCGMADGTLVVWDLDAEQRVLRFSAHDEAVSACTVTADGRRVLSASHDHSIRLWELGGPESLVLQDGHGAPVTACAASADGLTAVSASEDRTLKIWDIPTGARRATLEGHTDMVTACAISPDGSRVLSGARDGSLRMWTREGHCIQVLPGGRSLVSGCAITPDGRLITASQDGILRLFQSANGVRAVEIGEQGGSIDSLSVTPDGAYALSVSRNGKAKLWDLASHHCTRTLGDLRTPLLAGALTPDGKRVVLTRPDGPLEVHDFHGRPRSWVINGHEKRVFACAVSSDGTRAFSVSEDGTLRAYCLETTQCIGTLYGTSWFRCIARTHGMICAGDQEGNLWMITDGTEALGSYGPNGRPKGGGSLPPKSMPLLRDQLARIYVSPEAAQGFANDLHLQLIQLRLRGSAKEIWDSILDEAGKQSRLGDVLMKALKEYPREETLAELARLWSPRRR